MALLKKLKIFQLGDDTKGGEVTGVFQFKALMKYMITKVLLLQVVTMLKKMVNLFMVKGSDSHLVQDKIRCRVLHLVYNRRRIFQSKELEFAD